MRDRCVRALNPNVDLSAKVAHDNVGERGDLNSLLFECNSKGIFRCNYAYYC